jgi:Zn-dependent protease/CBS domain-containing protein
MRTWSFSLGRVLGAELRLHITFLFLLVFLAILAADPNSHGVYGTPAGALSFTLLVLAAVLLHEFAHLIAARGTKYIGAVMLLPIGGVPLRNPSDTLKGYSPDTEIRIALAGPFMSFVVAAAAAIAAALFLPHANLLEKPLLTSDHPLRAFVWLNAALGTLNLLPGLPLDGGRIVRASVARFVDYNTGTRRAVIFGQIFSTVFIFGGIMYPWLMFIGVLLFVGVQMESRSMVFQSVVETVRLEDIMLTDFFTLSAADTLHDALAKAVHSLQEDFPVVRGLDLVGIITRQRIVEALRSEGNGYVQSAMNKVFQVGQRSESLASAFSKIDSGSGTVLAVVDNDRLVGIVTLQNLMHSIGLLAETRRLKQRDEE